MGSGYRVDMLDFTENLTRLPTHDALTTVGGQWTLVKVDARIGRISFRPAADVVLSMATLADEASVDLGTQKYLTLDAGALVEYTIRRDLCSGCTATQEYYVGHATDAVRVEVTVEVG